MLGDIENPINSHPSFSASVSSLLNSSPLLDKIKRVSINFFESPLFEDDFPAPLLNSFDHWQRLCHTTHEKIH